MHRQKFHKPSLLDRKEEIITALNDAVSFSWKNLKESSHAGFVQTYHIHLTGIDNIKHSKKTEIKGIMPFAYVMNDNI